MFDAKLKSRANLTKTIAGLKARGRRIVFTNGCFDLLHYGHAKYLERAKAKGDILVVAVNSDSSVRRLKGKGRPVTPQRYRALMVASLASVDFVVIFNEETPAAIIAALKPDVLVKGGDWKTDTIVGADFVKGRGGKVLSIPFVPGFSTTGLIRRIAHAYR